MSPTAQPQGILGGIGVDSARVIAGSLDKFTAMIERVTERGATITFKDLTVKQVALSDGAISFDGLSGSIEIRPL